MPGSLGIDLTGTPRRATTCAWLADDLQTVTLADVRTDEELVAFAHDHQPKVIAIDAPLGFPDGWGCLDLPCACGRCTEPLSDRRRACEVELRQRGIACYWTTRRSIIKGMIYRALALVPQLAATRSRLIEVYPFGAKVRLWGRPLPKKTTPDGAAWYDAQVRRLTPGLAGYPATLSHDQVDAVLAAYTGLLHRGGRSEVLGRELEGQIVLPAVVQ